MDNLFNAELRDCARATEVEEQREQRAVGEVNRLLELSDDDFDAWYEGEGVRDDGLSAEELAKAQADWEAACDQGHDWNDYDEPIDLYGEDGYFGFDF
jgi:hypothetical protein|tara:strand:+ start:552 stop:845 length:294 start_codon:yes stop_codon:yes gene_type:complete